MVRCRACVARRGWSCGGPRPGEGPGAGEAAVKERWQLRGLGTPGRPSPGLASLRFASPRLAGCRGGGSGPNAGWLGPPAREPLLTPGPQRGHPARAGRAPGLPGAQARRLGEAPGMRSGGVSSRRCGGREGPGRRGWRPVLPAAARRSTYLPGGGGVWPAGGQEGSHACVWRERCFWFVCFLLRFRCYPFVFFHKGREEGVPALPRASLDVRLAGGVFLLYLFVALLLFLVLLFWRLASIRVAFIKNTFVLERAK